MTRAEAVMFYVNLVGVVGSNLGDEEGKMFGAQSMEAAAALGITVEERLAAATHLAKITGRSLN